MWIQDRKTEPSEIQLTKDLTSSFVSPTAKREAWKLLYERYYELLYKYIFILSNDSEICKCIIHDTWIAILEKGPKLKNPLAFKGYLLSTARNTFLNEIRLKRFEMLSLDENRIKDESHDVLNDFLKAEKMQYFNDAIEAVLELYPNDRSKIIRDYLENPNNITDIADKHKMTHSLANVYKIIERFKKHLKEKIDYEF